jgi:hypothetical protein
MKYYKAHSKEYYTLHNKLKDYEYIHFYIITQEDAEDKFERDIIEIEIDGEKVCRLPLLLLCCNYLFHEKKYSLGD